MAEYINKDDIPCVMYDDGSVEILLNKDGLDNLPTIDIVRCSECKYYENNVCWRRLVDCNPTPDWFCADGKRKEEQNDRP